MFDYVYESTQEKFHTEVIKQSFVNCIQKENIVSMMPLIWSEHCLECSAPLCYKTCSQFEANRYGRCKRTYYGGISYKNQKMDFPATQLKIKKWGKLRCTFNKEIRYDGCTYVNMYEKYLKKRSKLYNYGRILNFVKPKYKDIFARGIHHYHVKKYEHRGGTELFEEQLLLQIYSLNADAFALILDSYNDEEQLISRLSYNIVPGWNTWSVPVGELGAMKESINALELYPSNNFEAELIFFFSDLVTLNNTEKEEEHITSTIPASKIKCVVWDLDNTIWNGILGDDGIDQVSLKPEAELMIRKLDERGIIQSICSKNDFEYARKALEKFQLEKYFLYPQINWEHKAKSILLISNALNISIDTFAFIDDSPNEREEVKTLLPSVRVYSEKEISQLLNYPEFDVLISEDSKKRRIYYQNELNRKNAYQENALDFEKFIRSCDFKIVVSRCRGKQDVDRCHELIQRTNQLNASTNRISYDDFCNIVNDKSRDVIKLWAKDNFGEYGVVGCLILIVKQNTVLCTDFVISCRIAGKKVESALIYNIMEYFGFPMKVVYKKSDRNQVLKEELMAIGGMYDKEKNIISFKREKMINYDWVHVDMNLI